MSIALKLLSTIQNFIICDPILIIKRYIVKSNSANGSDQNSQLRSHGVVLCEILLEGCTKNKREHSLPLVRSYRK